MREIFEIDIRNLSIHDEAKTTPMMGKEQYDSLKSNIEENGQIDPITIFRSKIIDGRHRFLALNELNSLTINCVKMPHNSSIGDIRRVIRSKETRRHETATQLAISALRHIMIAKDKTTQAEAAKIFAVHSKTIGFAKKILVDYKREDLLDILFDGGKINIGTSYKPFMSDSLKTIVNWLDDNKATSVENKIGMAARTELTEDENIIVNQFVRSVQKESKFVLDEIANRIYSLVKGEE